MSEIAMAKDVVQPPQLTKVLHYLRCPFCGGSKLCVSDCEIEFRNDNRPLVHFGQLVDFELRVQELLCNTNFTCVECGGTCELKAKKETLRT